MGVLALIIFVVALILIGVGMTIGLALGGLAVGLVLLGIVSSSAAVGLWLRRPSAAVRMLAYQMSGLLWALVGAVVCLILSVSLDLGLHPVGALIAGGLAGGVAGLSLALMGLWMCESFGRWLAARAQRLNIPPRLGEEIR